jgi:hypothetical protein
VPEEVGGEHQMFTGVLMKRLGKNFFTRLLYWTVYYSSLDGISEIVRKCRSNKEIFH